MPPTFEHEHEQIVADGELVIVHSRFSGFGQAKNWIVADFVRVVDGLLVEHWDVVEDEASRADSKSGRPMFGDRFPAQQSHVEGGSSVARMRAWFNEQ
jgi:predicted SnoaL-like aldol condensation-catalyzing enzyme